MLHGLLCGRRDLASFPDTDDAGALLRWLAERLRTADTPMLQGLVRHLRRRHVAAIIFYGSCLFDETRTSTSFPDFYVLTDDLLAYHRSVLHAGLNLMLPPSVYYARFDDGTRCKYCVISTTQYLRETSTLAGDIHHLGRFSKRFALVHARDERVRDLVVRGALQAMMTLVPHSLALLPEAFSLEQFILTQLSLSYLGEQRVAEPDKVEKLFEAARDYYLELYPQVLALHLARHGAPHPGQTGLYRQPRASRSQKRATESFLRRSRYRGVLRWPKYILTVEDWLEYILDKLERHQGIRLELSERERRHPILFGWPRLVEMRRRGAVS